MTTKFDINNLTANDILSIYSGKPGCCCGFNGKHKCNPTHREEYEKFNGYSVTDEDLASPTAMTRMVNLFKKNASQLTLDAESNVSFETSTRSYIIYFTKAYIETLQG
jgi:hypothetical protein